MLRNLTPMKIIAILLFLRIPVLFMGVFGIISEDIALVMFLIFTYLFTAMFIEKYSGQLTDYFITPTSIIIFLLAPFFGILTMNDDPTAYIRAIIAIGLGYLLYKKNYFKSAKINKLEYNPLNILLLMIFIGTFIQIEKFFGLSDIRLQELGPKRFAYEFMFQISFAVASEEPLFRGMIMGEMLKRKIHPALIILTQGGIFWFSHIYYINTGLNFWIIHPILAIMLGVIAYKTKSITNSMAFHGVCNTLGSLFLRG